MMRTIYGKKCLLDTNILVYTFDAGSVKHLRAKQVFESFNRFHPFLPVQALTEFTAAMTRAYGLSQAVVAAEIDTLMQTYALPILYPTSAVLYEYLQYLKQDTGIYAYDLMIAATARVYNLDYIITDDRDFARIKGIKVFNPFEK